MERAGHTGRGICANHPSTHSLSGRADERTGERKSAVKEKEWTGVHSQAKVGAVSSSELRGRRCANSNNNNLLLPPPLPTLKSREPVDLRLIFHGAQDRVLDVLQISLQTLTVIVPTRIASFTRLDLLHSMPDAT